MTNSKQNDGLTLLNHLTRIDAVSNFHSLMSEMGYKSLNTRKYFIDPKTATIEPKHLCLICSLFGLSPEAFGYRSDYFKSRFSRKEAEAHLFCYNHSKEAEKAGRTFTENFFAEVSTYLLKVERELLVCDYLDKVRGIEQRDGTDYYHKCDEEYYLALEKRLEERLAEKKPIEYKRIIQLPLGAAAQKFEEGVDFVVEEMFLESFEHLCRCLRDFSEHCEFVVVMRPFRLHTYYLVDGEVALTEYHRYDTHGIPMPDTLFANFKNSSDPEAVGSVYLKACHDEFNRMKNSLFNTGCQLTKPMLIKSVVALDEQIRREIAEVKSLIKTSSELAQRELEHGAQINIFPQYASVQPRVMQGLAEWDHNIKRLDILRGQSKNIYQKRCAMSVIFNLQIPPVPEV